MIGNGKIHLVLLEPNPAVEPEVFSTLENHSLNGKQAIYAKILCEGIPILWRDQILQLIPEKRPLVSENPPETPSGVNSLFTENGPCEVLMGYE